MQYKKFGKTIVIRMDKGEEVVSSLKSICQKEDIKLASVSAIGAVNDITVGVFNPDTKQYKSNRFTGNFEIVSLSGTVTTMKGIPYIHLHMSVGDGNGKVFGGHLNDAKISATCEMVITLIEGEVEREYSEEIGLNLFKF